MKKESAKEGISWGLLSRYRNELYGICALWIVGLHAVGLFGVDVTFGSALLEPLDWFLRQNLGVDVFLLLSGISCYYSYSGNPEPGRFIARRIARVYPALLVTYGASWLLSVLLGNHGIPWMLWNMSLVPYFVEGNLNGAWYVSFIVLMYLLFPYIYAFIYGSERGERAALGRTIVLMVLASIVYWLSHKFALSWFSLVSGALARVPIFILGCYFGHFAQENRTITWGGTALLALLSTLWWGICYGVAIPGGLWWWSLLFSSFGGFVFAAVFVAMLSVLDQIVPKTGLIVRRCLRVMGACSLELYCTHLIVFYGSTHLLPKMGSSLPQCVFYFFVAFLWSWLCIRVLEPLLVKGIRCFAQRIELCLGD